ncbi:hypothetical protein C8J57DRAFT_1234216 [Mycena rebaudengoi]|nr:hypothetical protein C8J57DRAFT_1234216 [Mycena rebaudengoi]
MVGTMLRQMETDIIVRHHQMLDLIQDSVESDTGSSAFDSVTNLEVFSSVEAPILKEQGTISLLPGTPKIFHGRETVLERMLRILLMWPARVAILGSAGIGKTSLALAALHDARLVLKFPRRYFVSCEGVLSIQDLLLTLSSYLAIVATNRDLKGLILQSLAEGGPCILVLDNFETPWEFSEESRSKTEEFLSHLTEIEQLALVVTMRGLERPGNVQWTRPFFPPLEPLDDVSARKVFLDIADEPVDKDEEAQMTEILRMTDNLPLAINLLANTAAFEGCGSTLARYRAETTEILSHGHDKNSNLNKSIMLSLCSRRFRAVPDAATLLALMSLLPDGISDAELGICAEHIPNILRCRSTLIRTSMAFVRPDHRLRVLAPIREYMQKLHPPSFGIVKPLTRYLGGLLGRWNAYRELGSVDLVDSINANLANIRSLMEYGMRETKDEMTAIGYGILDLDAFLYDIHRVSTDLFERVPEIIEKTGHPALAGFMTCALLEQHGSTVPQSEAAALIHKAADLFQSAEDPVGEAQLYNAATTYYARACNITELCRFNGMALAISNSGDAQKLRAIMCGCRLKMQCGDPRGGILLATQGRIIARRMGNLILESRALEIQIQIQASLCALSGQLSRALSLCKEARQSLIACGLENSTGYLAIIDIEAVVHLQQTDYRASRASYAEILRIASPLKFDRFCMNSLMRTIHLDVLLNTDAADILGRLDTVTSIAKRTTASNVIWYCDLVRGEVKHREGDRLGAAAEHKRCLKFFRGADVWSESLCLEYLSDIYLQERDFDEALRWAGTYLAQSRQTGIIQKLHALRRIGDVLIANGDIEGAATLYTVGFETFTEIGVHCGRAECAVGLGEVSSVRGDTGAAVKLWTEAQEIFNCAGRVLDVADMETKLNR